MSHVTSGRPSSRARCLASAVSSSSIRAALPRACASRQQQRERPAGQQGHGCDEDPLPALGQQDEEDGGRRGQHEGGNGGEPGTGAVLLIENTGGFTRVAPGPAGYNPGGAVPMVGRMVEVAPVADEADGAALARRLHRDVAAREFGLPEVQAFKASLLDYADLLAREDGVVLGSGFAALFPGLPDSPRVMVTVPPGHRGRGAGTALYSAISDWAMERELETLEAVLADNDPDSLAFAERRGFVVERHEKGVALDLTAVEPPPVEPPPGVEIVSWADRPELARGLFESRSTPRRTCRATRTRSTSRSSPGSHTRCRGQATGRKRPSSRSPATRRSATRSSRFRARRRRAPTTT